MITVLVTCVGSGVGQSVIDSLNLKGGYKIVGCDGNRNVYAHSYCDVFYTVSSLYSEGYINEIIGICKANNVDIVVPGHDHELTLFGSNRELFEKENIKVLVSEPTVTEISRNKKDWYDYFAPKGCKIVPTLTVENFLKNPDYSIFPAIVKPSGGSASQGISIINNKTDLEGLNNEDIIQPYLFPEKSDANYEAIKKAVQKGDFIQKSEISIQILFDKDSKHAGTFISKNTLKNGIPIFVDPINPSSFEYIDEILKFVPILESKKVRGPVNIQGRVTPNGLYFFEMNMRFTGITGNRALLGFNEVDYLVKNFLGKKTDPLNGYAYNKLGVRQVACSTISRTNETQQSKTLTVLGAGSTFGKKFIDSLNLNGYQKVYLISRKSSVEKYTKTFTNSVFEIVPSDSSKLSSCFTQTDVLVNFVSALAYEEDQIKYEAIRYIYKMMPLISKAKIPQIINISSQSVYDQNDNTCKNEKANVVMQTSYQFQKLIIEDFMSSAQAYNTNTKVTNLRLPRILDTSCSKQVGFFGTIVSNVINKKATTISNPNNNTNLIDINDAVSAINFVIKNTISEPVLNVSGTNIDMKAYCEEVKKQLNEKSTVIYNNDESITSSSMLNGEKLTNYGWSVSTPINKIIEKIIEGIKNSNI